MINKIFKILAMIGLTVVVWAVFDIWLHDYGLVPYYKGGYIESATKAYLYGFWTFAVLNILVISIISRAWHFFVSLMIIMVSGAEDFAYYLLQPFLNPSRAIQRADFIPDKLPWLNDNLWLKFLSGGEMVTEKGLYFGLIIGLTIVIIYLFLVYRKKYVS